MPTEIQLLKNLKSNIYGEVEPDVIKKKSAWEYNQ